MADVVLTPGKEGDQRTRTFTIKDKDGTPVNLTGLKVTLYIAGPGTNTSVNTTDDPTVLDLLDAINGVVRLRPTASTFATGGSYRLHFLVHATTPFYAPSDDGYMTLQINAGGA